MADPHPLITEIMNEARKQGLKQSDIAAKAAIRPDYLSRLKKADDARISTLEALGKVVGKRLAWVDEDDDISSLVSKGELF
jgi:predicted transcriptional regulator